MPSALRRAFLFQAVAKVFAKGVKMINDRMSAANKGILSTARIKEGSKIQTGSHLQPHSNVGFFVLWAFLLLLLKFFKRFLGRLGPSFLLVVFSFVSGLVFSFPKGFRQVENGIDKV
jgi:RsiW-degrading membrane proteinase PrsW (M82 family)